MSSALKDFWDQTYAGIPPVAHELRELLQNRWVRFYSLPEGKRYADNALESQTVIARQESLLKTLAGDSPITVVTTAYSPSETPELPPVLAKVDSSAAHWRTIAMHDDDLDDPNYWHLFARTYNRSDRRIAQILDLVATEAISNVILLSVGDSWLMHPYDGGTDVIMPTAAKRLALALRYSEWRSPRPDGL